MPTIEDIDIGMEARDPDAGSGDPSPPKPPQLEILSAEDDDDEDIDETLTERLIGLTEMFPQPLVSFSSKVFNFSWEASKFCYSAGRVALWVATSSATILALPVMFESERAQMEEQQLQQQRQILLGPNAAMSQGGANPMGGVPMPVPQR